MPSGEFTSVPIDSIWVDRAKRQRQEIAVDDLMQSISAVGLIHPPVIKRDGELIVGERRWTACRALGWTAIPIQWEDELDEIELQAIEFEENVKRIDLPWQDQVRAVERYHNLRKSQDEAWTQIKTAERLGLSQQVIANWRSIAQEMAINPAVAAAPKLSTAKSMTFRITQRREASVGSAIAEAVGNETVREVPLLNADFAEWQATYTGPKFNFIHCDFPYGVNMHTTDQGGARHEFGSYADDPKIFFKLLEVLRASMANVVDDNAHLMFWFSMDFYETTRRLLDDMGWKTNRFPLIWMKNDNTGVIPDANRQPRRIYETCFFASRGDRFIREPVSNAFAAPGRDKSLHMNEKPVAMLKHFMRMFCDQYSTVLDPTCGSANALKAATALGARTVLGVERDPQFYNLARENFYDDTNGNLDL